MRLVFLGTGDIALPSFQALLDSEHELVGLISQPDKPVGRKQVLTPPKIKTLAQKAGVEVWQPERVGSAETLECLARWNAEVIVVMAYGQILPQALLDLPSLACINLHASLLPKYRGAACIQAAIKEGETHTGITVIHVVKKLDAGEIICAHEIEILPGETGGALHDRLAELAPLAMNDALEMLEAGTAPRVSQDLEQVTYIGKLLRKDGELDFSQSASALARQVCAYDPWPGTYAVLNSGGRLKIFPPVEVDERGGTQGQILAIEEGRILVAGGEGSLWIEGLQPEGSRRLLARDYLNGAPLAVGEQWFLARNT